jgi:hypothetical protein
MIRSEPPYRAQRPSVQTAPRRIRFALAILLLACAGAGASASTPSGESAFEIRNGTVASGGGDISGGHYQLTGSFGEPVTGTVAAEGFELTAGFPATLNEPNQIIFINGFEPKDDQP